MTDIAEVVSDLKKFENLKEVPENQLEWLARHSEIRVFKEGEFVFHPDEPIDHTLFVIKGAFRFYLSNGKQETELAYKSAGEITGYLPFSRAKISRAYGRVVEDTELLYLPKSCEKEMIRDHYELTQVLVHEMTSRVREFTNFQKQNEKMAALGKLSAGLAHELNNPASAVVRSSLDLKKQLQLQPEKFKKVMTTRVEPPQVDAIISIMFEKIRSTPPNLGLLKRKALEDEIIDWLDEYEVIDAGTLAESLVDYGFELTDIETIASHCRKEDLGVVLDWIGDNLVIEKMVGDIQEASLRISDLVKSVKIYTHMDRAPEKTNADIHEGIRNTLKILNHKTSKSGVEVVLIFDESIPPVPIYVSEMNQVWTNLLDNALDAVAGQAKPRIEIVSKKVKENVVICIRDNGTGIPEDILGRIWEPFFTTKEMGKGTGLGLETVKNIVEMHNGKIKVKSAPGNTEFELCFPAT